MPRFALVLAIGSLACSLSVIAFFVGVSLGILAVVMALSALVSYPNGSASHRSAQRAFVVGGLGLLVGVLVWVVHVRAIQTAYHIPSSTETSEDFRQHLATATAPTPGAPPRTPAPVPKSPDSKEQR